MPFGAMRQRFLSAADMACQKPPFGALSAIDLKTKSLMWQMPVGSPSGLMTYVSAKTGKQYIPISAGGARQSPDRGDYVIAYALP